MEIKRAAKSRKAEARCQSVKMSPFKGRVISIVRMIPKGRVASYGQVALYAGLPRAAREVGWILNQTGGENLPWWRVISNKGVISISGARIADPRSLQKKLLEVEKITVSDSFEVDMAKYRWKITAEDAKRLRLSDAYIKLIIEKYDI